MKFIDSLMQPLEQDILHDSLWSDKCDYIEMDQCKNLNKNNMNLVVLQLNIHSLLAHQQDLKRILMNLREKNTNVDIILLCETFLNECTEKLVNIPGYEFLSNNRKQSKGGGTVILVRSGIKYKCRQDLEHFEEKILETT